MPSVQGLPVAVLVSLFAACTATAPTAGAATKWLCHPGAKTDPCRPRLKTTVFTPGGERIAVQDVRRARRPRVDWIEGKNGAPDLAAGPTDDWGLHIVDPNLALAELTAIVRRQASSVD